MDHGHTAELRAQVWDGCPGSSGRILAHFPAFCKLGQCQGLMHQIELVMDSRCGGTGNWPGTPPMRPGPAGEVSKQWDLLCALPVPPLLEEFLQAELGRGLGPGWAGRKARLGAGWPAEALLSWVGASCLPRPHSAPIHDPLFSRFSAEQTRMVSLASLRGETGCLRSHSLYVVGLESRSV